MEDGVASGQVGGAGEMEGRGAVHDAKHRPCHWTLSGVLGAVRGSERCPCHWMLSRVLGAVRGADRCRAVGEGKLSTGLDECLPQVYSPQFSSLFLPVNMQGLIWN